MRIYFPKLVPPCPLTRSQALSPQSSPKSVISSTTIGDVTSPTPILTAKSPNSLRRNFSSPIRCELSRLRCHGHRLLLSSYLDRISRKENSACSASGHPLQDLNHLLLDCPASEPLRKSIFGPSLSILDLRVQTLGYGPPVRSPRSFSAPPSLRRGRVVPPPPLPTLRKCDSATVDNLDKPFFLAVIIRSVLVLTEAGSE